MRVEIEIPKEFESHFELDRFEDSLHRLCADSHLLAGNYEKETAEMLIKSFKAGIIVSDKSSEDADNLAETVVSSGKQLKGTISCKPDEHFNYGFLKRIADYFVNNYEGEDSTAPKLDFSVNELRDIIGLHSEKCRLETMLRQKENDNWILVKTRPLTEEEKEYYADEDITFMYDCSLPDDGEEVLVTTNMGNVALTTFYTDYGCYFEDYEDEGEVVAWQKKPSGYKE